MRFLKVSTVGILLILTGCGRHLTSERKKLDEKVINSGDISISWYKVSTITTIHEYVDLSRWKQTKNVLEANGGVREIQIKGDTIIISTTPTIQLYELVSKTLGCTIVQDTSATNDGL